MHCQCMYLLSPQKRVLQVTHSDAATDRVTKPAAQLAMWRVHIHLQKMQWSSCHNVQKRLVDIQIPFVGLCLDVHRFMHAQNGKHVAGGPNKVLHPMS